MFFLFGWGHQTRKDFGSVISLKCNHCNNEDYWHLLRSTTWFTLFFIPVIPYSVEKYLLCPVCQYGITLDDAKFNELKPIAEANQLLITGQISEDEHRKRLGLKSENNDINNVMESENQIKGAMIYCRMCGKEIVSGASFCKYCGNKIV